MQRTTRRLAATTTAAVVLLLGLPAPPASATALKEVVFAGFASVPAGLGYPGVGAGGGPNPAKVPCTEDGTVEQCIFVETGPKGEPVLELDFVGGNTSGFDFESVLCSKASWSTDIAKKAPGPAFCTVQAVGVVHGFCGLLAGFGVLAVSNAGLPPFTGPLKSDISFEVDLAGIGGVLLITGGDLQTNVYGVAWAIPVPAPPGGPSCSTKTANEFLLAGTLKIKDITL